MTPTPEQIEAATDAAMKHLHPHLWASADERRAGARAISLDVLAAVPAPGVVGEWTDEQIEVVALSIAAADADQMSWGRNIMPLGVARRLARATLTTIQPSAPLPPKGVKT